MSSSTLPPCLKKINVFLKRAEELDRDKSNPESRVVAYNCRQYAALIGIPLVTSSSKDNDAAKKALGQLLTTLESEKTAMSVFSKAEHWKISRKVADRVFDKADAEDRAGVANKGTARSFYAAATFYEILQQFHDEEIKAKNDSNVEEELNEDEASIVEHMEEEDQRRVYCKWKATDILTAIKEGRVPQPGGYKKEEEEEEVVDDAENNTDGVVNNDEVVPPAYEDKNAVSLPPPAPSMPSSDLFEIPSQNDNYEKHSETNNMPPPPSYDGIELSLSGQPTTTTITEDTTAQETTNNGDLFIPAPPVAIPPPPVSAPPAYTHQNISSNNQNDNSNNNGGKGMFSSIFQSNKSSNTKKLTKAQMGDAIELTKFALAALQKGDGELGRERLEQALGVWK